MKGQDVLLRQLRRPPFASVAQVTRIRADRYAEAGDRPVRDANGNVQQFNLASAACAVLMGTALCDPRGLGISPFGEGSTA
jgi:hypothetical protein